MIIFNEFIEAHNNTIQLTIDTITQLSPNLLEMNNLLSLGIAFQTVGHSRQQQLVLRHDWVFIYIYKVFWNILEAYILTLLVELHHDFVT